MTYNVFGGTLNLAEQDAAFRKAVTTKIPFKVMQWQARHQFLFIFCRNFKKSIKFIAKSKSQHIRCCNCYFPRL